MLRLQLHQVRRQRQHHSATSHLVDPRFDQSKRSNPYSSAGWPQGHQVTEAGDMFGPVSGAMGAFGTPSDHSRHGGSSSSRRMHPSHSCASHLMGGTGGLELPPNGRSRRRSTTSNVTRSGSVLTAPVTDFLGPSQQRLDQLTVGELLTHLTAALHAQEQQE
jgi:hypothetical protein